jgi:hypothetical protein
MPNAPAAPGYNVEGGTVFDNFVGLYNRGQLFILYDFTSVYEKPAVEPTTPRLLFWCGNLAFSDYMKNNSSSYIGYAGRCVVTFLKELTELLEAGAQFSYEHGPSTFKEPFIATWGLGHLCSLCGTAQPIRRYTLF